MESKHSEFMRRCLQLAALGGRQVAPNPMVGALVVHNGTVIGEGYHQRFGGPHAEVMAIGAVTDPSLLSESTLYVSLEPCCHHGKTPPCTDLILRSRIPYVVVGLQDPFPRVAGKGVEILRNAGVRITRDVLKNECAHLNRRFITFHTHKRPYVILKWAQTQDGFIARTDYSSKWISSEESRQLVHRWRSEEMAVLVGYKTALVDNPQLTVRHVAGVNPLRVVLDAALTLPADLHLLRDGGATLIFNDFRDERRGACEFVRCPTRPFAPGPLLSALYQRGVSSLLVEGGSQTLQAFLNAEAWDEARIFESPQTFGAGMASPLCSGEAEVQRVGVDTLRTIFRSRFLV